MLLQYENSNWWVGTVEDRLDPLEQGRVRVRVLGAHPFSRIQGEISGIPVEDLPWMSVLLPVTNPAVAGLSGAVTGLVPGSNVFGIWLDKYKTNGLVLGSYSGNQVAIPNSAEGFSDPSGQYPDYAGPDTSRLNSGGAYGDSASSNTIQNSNGSTGLFPGAVDNSTPDDAPNFTMEKMLTMDEGVRDTVYWDSLGYPTIGIGHLIVSQKTKDMTLILKALSSQLGHSVGKKIPQSDIATLFSSDLAKVQSSIKKHSSIAPAYLKCNRSRQMALENMAFQMGVPGLGKFKTFLGLLAAGNYTEAAAQAKDSLWAKQTPGRASRICLVIKNGNVGAYGVAPKTSSTQTNNTKSTAINQTGSATESFNPYDNSDVEIYPDYSKIVPPNGWTEDLSGKAETLPNGILFQEPKSSYMGVYPYVQAFTSEGGHTQEFDNTPGHERYKLAHPTGSYTEVSPDGKRIDKSVGDMYSISNGARNELTDGPRNVNVGGKEIYYNFSDVVRHVDGSTEFKVSKDSNKVIDGNKTDEIKGNRSISVKGNDVLNIDGDGTIKVSGNVKIIVSGNLDCEASGNINLIAGGELTLDGSKINLGK